MRLAVSIAAWSKDPDATFPPEGTPPDALSAELAELGFTTLAVDAEGLPASLAQALVGVEPADILLVHIAGVITADGALERPREGLLALSSVTSLLADAPCNRSLVMVEGAYRGEADSFRAVDFVEAVATALSCEGAPYTTLIAAHPMGADVQKLGFTRAVLAAVPEVVKSNGVALIDHAFARAREGQMAGVASSGFALLHGEAPFYVSPPAPTSSRASSPALRVPPPAPVTEPIFGGTPAHPSVEDDPATVEPAAVPVEAVASPTPPVPLDRDSTRAFDLVDIASSRPGAIARMPSITVELSPEPPAPPPAEPSAPVLSSSDVPTVPFPSSIDSGEGPVTLPRAKTPRADLDARVVAATADGQHHVAVELRRQRLPLLETVEERVDELFEIGRTLVAKLKDLPQAVQTLEEARAMDASRVDVLEALRRAYGRLDRGTEAFEVTLALVKHTEDPRERAGLRVAAASLARQHLSDDDYALELLGLALNDDPSDEAALDEIVRIRRSRGELDELERTLESLAHRLIETSDAARAWDVCQRLAALRRDDLADAAGAVEALSIAKRLPLSELDSRAVLAEQLLALNDDEGAVAELEAIIAEAPEQTRAHARLVSVHQRTGQHDKAYLSALVLEELGAADATSREILEARRSDWGLRARAALDDRAWDRLRACGSDDVIEDVFRASLRAAIAAQVEDRPNRLTLDPARRQSESSTASIIRCFHWAARALGVECPALYVLDDVKGGIAAVPLPEPSTALGPQVLHGLSSRTLAFLAGRHLTYFRPEHQVLVHFPTAEAAAGLFFAAVELVAPGTFVPSNLALRVASAKNKLARHLRPDELARLSSAVGRLEAREARIDLIAWIRSIELTAGRAGLLLAGDLQTALAQVRSEPRGLSGLSVEERRADLVAFCASRTLADMRASYSDTSPSSMRPPTSENSVVRRLTDDESASRLMA